jgi:hypothetical protein
VNALADADVGKYLNTYFASSFQKIGTFRLAGARKQGGNVASYFCTPAGQVLHVVAGPVNAAVLLREARWVVEMWKLAQLEKQDSGPGLRSIFSKAHTERLRREHGLAVREPGQLGDHPPPTALVRLLQQPKSQKLNPAGQVHAILAVAALMPIEQIYPIVFEQILGETLSMSPVEVVGTP